MMKVRVLKNPFKWQSVWSAASISLIGNYCETCKDTGMIYSELIGSEDEEGPDPFEVDLKEAKERWNVFFSSKLI
jgi:hypothetical protein